MDVAGLAGTVVVLGTGLAGDVLELGVGPAFLGEAVGEVDPIYIGAPASMVSIIAASFA